MAQVPDSDEWEYRESPSLTVYDNESNPVIGCVLGPDGDVLRVVRAWKPFPFVFTLRRTVSTRSKKWSAACFDPNHEDK